MPTGLRVWAVILALVTLLGLAPLTSVAQNAVTPQTAAAEVATMISRIDTVTAAAKGHRFAPTYYEPPCQPTKDQGEASLAPYRRELRELRAQAQTLRDAIIELEKRSDNKLAMGEAGWDWQDAKRFDRMNVALSKLAGAIADLEAQLDKMRPQPCRPPSPDKPKEVIDGPTGEDVRVLEDYPVPPPVFDEPIPDLVLPEKFCSYAEYNRYLKEVFWPWQERFKQNALKAIDHMTKLEQRRATMVRTFGLDSPQTRAADKFITAWQKPKADRMAANEKALKVHDAIGRIPVVDCGGEQPKTDGVITGGGQPPPVTDGPGTTNPPLPELVRPPMKPVADVNPPAFFCSETDRVRYMNDVYIPASAVARGNAEAAKAHLTALNALFTEHMRKNSPQWGAIRIERDAYEQIAAAETARATALAQLYKTIMAIPVRDCGGDKPKEENVIGGGGGPLVQPPTDDGEAGPTEIGGFTFPELRTEPLPTDLCVQGEEQRAEDIVERAMRQVAENEQRLREARGELEVIIRDGKPAEQEAARSQLEGLKDVDARIQRDRQKAEALKLQLEQMKARKDCNRPRTTEKPCPPKTRIGRDPIIVGPNNKVGTGAKLQQKVTGMAVGALAGALGLGGGGGGGGGGDGPDLWKCKIKEGEYTAFDSPSTGIQLKVAAKRQKGGQVVVFSKIAKSPDKGTFQTSFMEKPQTGQVMAPADIGPCDLWGEWKLTVSWTKRTYVNGALVKEEKGSWFETGKFKVPGMLSSEKAPDGYWKQMGQSSAASGVQEMAMIYNLPKGGGPMTLVIHVTRPKRNPVDTEPFIMTLTEQPDGTFIVTRGEPAIADDDCPPYETQVRTTEKPPPTLPPAPKPDPAVPPPQDPRAGTRNKVNPESMASEGEFVGTIPQEIAEVREALDKAEADPCADLKAARDRLVEARRYLGRFGGELSDYGRQVVEEARERLRQIEQEIDEKERATRNCPTTSTRPPSDLTVEEPQAEQEGEDILDDMGEQELGQNPTFGAGEGASAPPKTPPKPPGQPPPPTVSLYDPKASGMTTTGGGGLPPADTPVEPPKPPVIAPKPPPPTTEARPADRPQPKDSSMVRESTVQDPNELEKTIDYWQEHRRRAREELARLNRASCTPQGLRDWESARDALFGYADALILILRKTTFTGPAADEMRQKAQEAIDRAIADAERAWDMPTPICTKPLSEQPSQEDILDDVGEEPLGQNPVFGSSPAEPVPPKTPPKPPEKPPEKPQEKPPTVSLVDPKASGMATTAALDTPPPGYDPIPERRDSILIPTDESIVPLSAEAEEIVDIWVAQDLLLIDQLAKPEACQTEVRAKLLEQIRRRRDGIRPDTDYDAKEAARADRARWDILEDWLSDDPKACRPPGFPPKAAVTKPVGVPRFEPAPAPYTPPQDAPTDDPGM